MDYTNKSVIDNINILITGKANKRVKVCSLLLCLMPILDPYVLFPSDGMEIHLVDLVLILLVGLQIIKSHRIYFRKDLLVVMIIMMVANIITFSSQMSGNQFGITLRVWIIWMIYILLYSTISQVAYRDLFYKYAGKIAEIATAFLFIQFGFTILGIDFWDGQLPFLPLSKTDGWAKLTDITGSVRVHSFFQEPSYYGMYVLPVFAYSLLNKDIRRIVILGAGIAISTSSLGIAGAAIALVCFFVFRKKGSFNAKHFLIWFSLFCIAGIVGFVLYTKSPQIRFSVDYMVKKVINTGVDLRGSYMGTTKIRILGNIYLFDNLSVMKKIFGLGINQYFLVYPQVEPYSNTMVTLLLNSGIVTAVSYLIFGIKATFSTNKEYYIFGILFLFVMFTDLCLFTWYAFYLIYWTDMQKDHENRKKYICIKIG